MEHRKHLAILGAGPGGYVAAIRAAQMGGRVTVIENQALGGVCLNWGCIPSKALLSVVELGEKVRKAGEMGLVVQGPVQYDLAQMVKRKNAVIENLVKGIASLFKTWDITHIQGTGQLLDERTIRVAHHDGTERTVESDAIVIATGSSWPNLPLFPVNGRTIMTTKEAFDLTDIPSRMLIVGGGIEGCECASLYGGLGAHVDLVEMMPRILPTEDSEVAGIVARELKKRGVQLYVGTKVETVQNEDTRIRATLTSGESIQTEKILVSIGRTCKSGGLGLEKVGVQCGTRGEITVNERMETTVPGVYAVGDVVGKAMLAHVASAQGKAVAETILGHPQTLNEDVIPAGIFTLPEIGRVGLTEEQAQERGFQTKVGRFRYAGLGKAHAVGDVTGLFKFIIDAGSEKILGVHIIGSHAADLIHEAALGMQMGAPVSVLAKMIHAHPTVSEGLMEAAEDVFGLAIHQAKKRL